MNEPAHMKTNLFKNLKTSYVQEITDIPTILEMIRQGDYKDQIREARTYGKGNESFERIKQQIPTFSPNGIFNRIRAQKNIQTLSGFIYLDIDHPVDPAIFCQLPWVYACWKSFGGINYGLLASVSGLTKDNFNDAWTYLDSFFSELKITVDKHTKDISRQCVISYDPDIYINQNSIPLIIPVKDISNCIKNNSSLTHTGTNPTYITTPDSTLYKLKYQTTLNDYYNQDYVVIESGKEYRSSYLPRVILDGERNKWLCSYTSSILYNNPTITCDTLRQVVYKANRDHCHPALTLNEINSIVTWSFDKHINQKLKIKTKKKKIWFNPESKLSTKQKRSIVGQQTGILRRKQTISELIQVYITLDNNDQRVTQKLLEDHSNYSLRTIKRYWNDITEGVICKQEEEKEDIY